MTEKEILWEKVMGLRTDNDGIDDLFVETIEMLNREFLSSFEVKDVKPLIKNGTKEEIVFINEQFLIPYLEFMKMNKRVMKMIHKRPILFKNENVYKQMCEELFFPIISRFGVPKEEQVFRLEFFTRGIAAVIYKWIELDCEMPIEKIMKIIIESVNFNEK